MSEKTSLPIDRETLKLLQDRKIRTGISIKRQINDAVHLLIEGDQNEAA